jgi:hypothetical protein
MEIKHTLVASEAECHALFEVVKDACLLAYPSKDAQDKGLDLAKIKHKEILDKQVNEAFQIGYKVGLNQANTKDDIMYK